jgi:hypothetical protein
LIVSANNAALLINRHSLCFLVIQQTGRVNFLAIRPATIFRQR